MEKLGFAFERDTLYAGLPHVLYRCGSTVHVQRAVDVASVV